MKKITISLFTVIMMLSLIFATGAFAAPGTTGVEYRGHIQNYGNFPTDGSWIQGPAELGTEGQSLRLEGFWIQLNGTIPAGANIKYDVHVQDMGWLFDINDTSTWAKNGEFAGSEGQSRRIEAIKIVLVDDAGVQLPGYSVVYSGHIQNKGNVGPFTNGEQLGTVGESLRLEAIKVQIIQSAADLAAYTAALAAVTEADYTADSWTAYQLVVAANVVTAQNTQAEVDAATAAIIAAQADLVKLTEVTSVTAVDVNKIEVVFNQAITDQAAAKFALKKGFANINIASVEWSEDGTTATVTSAAANLNTSTKDTATYTLTITGLTEEALVNTVDFEPVVESALVITSEQIDFIVNAPLAFEVQNQYGKNMNVSATDVVAVAWNITQDKDQPIETDNDGIYFPDFVTEGPDQVELGDEISVTLIYKDFMVEETLTVGEEVIVAPATIELGTVVPLEDNTMILTDDEGLVLPATITDQFGEVFVLPEAPATSNMVSRNIQGITFTSSNRNVIDVGSISVDADGVITFDVKDAGTAKITAFINKTGDVSTTTVEVNEEAVLATLAIDPPADIVAANDGTVELTYVAEDQYGNVLDWNNAADKALIQEGFAYTDSSDTNIVNNDGMALNDEGKLVVTLAGDPGDVTLTALNSDEEELGSVSFEVLEDAVLTSIDGVKDLITTVSENATTTIGADNLIIKDQYGRDYTLSEDEGALVYFKTVVSDPFIVLSDTDIGEVTGADIDHAAYISANNDVTISADVTGTDVAGTSTLVIALVTDITAEYPADTAVVGGTFNVDITNVTEFADYAIQDVDTLYGNADNDDDSTYDKVITVVGLDADGNEVVIDQNLITALTSSNPAVIGTDVADMKVFGLAKGSATISAWIGDKKVASTVVTASDEAPAGQTVVFEDADAVIPSDEDTVDLADGLTVVDQYGVELDDPASLGTWTSSDEDIAIVDQTGYVTAETNDGGEATISFVLDNGNASGSVLVTVEAV